MINLLNRQVKGIQMSAIREFSDHVKGFDDGIDLTIGQPDFNTPEHVKSAGKTAVDSNQTFYTNSAGTEELRKAASRYYSKYGLNYDWKNEVIVTNGATQALDTVFRTILEEGAEVIIAGPAYPGYQPLIEMAGAEPVFVDTTNHNFKMTADLIKPYLTNNTRAILLSYPSNPVGVCLNENELSDIAELIKDKGIFIVSDEIYSELIYDGDHHSIATFSEIKAQTIIINGLSKSHSMTGWRVGFLFAPAYLLKELLKVHLFNTSCANSISQEAAVNALSARQDEPLRMKEQYRERRDFIFDRLSSMGIEVSKPQAAFYIFPSIKSFGIRSFEFANQLLEEEHVAVVPGSSFSEIGEGYIRISFANSMEVIDEGLNRFEKFINRL